MEVRRQRVPGERQDEGDAGNQALVARIKAEAGETGDADHGLDGQGGQCRRYLQAAAY
jgi:hypothetical protein